MTTDVCNVTADCVGACATDAVISVDVHARITGVNAAARRWLGAEPAELLGRPVLDAVVSPALCTLILGALISTGPCEGRAALLGEPEQPVTAHAEPLTDEAGAPVGGLLVLSVGES